MSRLGGALTYIVPAGFQPDFASVPRAPVAFMRCGDTASEPAALHDWLYSLGPNGQHPVPDRSTADALAEVLPRWRVCLLWAGMHIGGESHRD